MIISRSTIITEGLHEAKITQVEKGRDRQTLYGSTPTMSTHFELTKSDIKIVQSILIFNGSKLQDQLINTTLEPGVEEIDVNDFINKRCVIRVKHNHVSGVTYPNVVDIYPIEKLEEIEPKEKAATNQ